MSAVQIQGNASGTGTLTIAAPSTNTNQTLTLPDQTGTLIAGTSGVAGEANGGTGTTTGYYGFKNRIINGGMVINQRGSTTVDVNGYAVDRFVYGGSLTSKAAASQDTSVYPAGFNNSYKILSSSAYTVPSGEYYFIYQAIEGYNMADLGWGASGAQTATLSFWVRSSLTGTFGGVFRNNAGDRNYPFTYTISSANTWEQKSVTVAGDTTGTWLKTNGNGLSVVFGLGVGSTLSGTAGAWSSNNYLSATGATSVVGTNGATFYITGVQLEKGSTATSFDYRPYGTELVLCQRYLPAFIGNSNWFGFGIGASTTAANVTVNFPVTTRVAPTGITVSNVAHFAVTDNISISQAATAISFVSSGTSSALLQGTTTVGVTIARPTTLASISASANLYFTGCEL